MKSGVFAVAFVTVDDEGNTDLYTEALIATSPAEAIGLSILEGNACEALGMGQRITMVDCDAASAPDVYMMVKNNDAIEAEYGGEVDNGN